MHKCLTVPLLFGSKAGCLVEKPQCSHAHGIGFSFMCLHPDSDKFHAHKTETLTTEEALAKYDSLREKRRHEFVSNLDETGRDIFQLIQE